MNKKLIALVLIVIVAYYLWYNSKREYLYRWAKTDPNTSAARIPILKRMTKDEIAGMYKIVKDYFNNPEWNKTITKLPPDLAALWEGLHIKYDSDPQKYLV